MAGIKVEFRQSGKTLEWEDRFENLLEFAEANDIPLESNCQQGFCGTCKTRLISGKVEMERTDGLEAEDIEESKILVCVSVPVTDVVLEA
jgi:ferredoxin